MSRHYVDLLCTVMPGKKGKESEGYRKRRWERERVHDGEERIREDRKGCWDRDKGVKKREGVHDGDRRKDSERR